MMIPILHNRHPAAEAVFVTTLVIAIAAILAAVVVTAFGRPEVAYNVRWLASLVETAAAVICAVFFYNGRKLCFLPAAACISIAFVMAMSL